MTDHGELHAIFGTGPVGLAVMDELVSKGKRVRMVNRSGRANVPEGVEVVGGDAADPTFTREVSEGASVVYFALNPPYNKWPELFPGLQAGVLWGEAHSHGEPLHVRAHIRPATHRGSTLRGQHTQR
jgi:hypothetical protein